MKTMYAKSELNSNIAYNLHNSSPSYTLLLKNEYLRIHPNGTCGGEAVPGIRGEGGSFMNTIHHLLSGKIRLRLLMKFFLNPGNQEYLRGLAQEFDVSTNTVRQELNKLSETGVLSSHEVLNKRYYQVNEKHALFEPIRKMLMRHTGLDSLYEMVLGRLGNLQTVFLTGALASGVDSPIIDLIMVGDIDRDYLHQLIPKAEDFIGKKIRVAVFTPDEWTDDVIEGQQVMRLM